MNAHADHALHLDHLAFAYDGGPQVFTELSLRVGWGEVVGLLGPNGSGKTTLLHLIVGLLRGEGHLRVAGLDLNRHNLKAIRRDVGLVMQETEAQLFMPTVLDDVMFGPLHAGADPDAARALARRALARVALDTFETRSAHHLSGGEKRRVALAGVLAMNPRIILLDEPNQSLDPRARNGLIELLAGLQTTMIIASHDLDLVWDVCPRTIILDGGRIVADGPTDTLLRDAPLLRAHGLDLPLSLQPRPASPGDEPRYAHQ